MQLSVELEFVASRTEQEAPKQADLLRKAAIRIRELE